MDNTKKIRNMTAKGFLHKASGKHSASAFLEQHREWLLTGDLANVTAPILLSLDNREIMPTPALEAIKGVVLGHMLAKETATFTEALLNPKTGSKKPWQATIFDAAGNIQTRVKENGEIEELQKTFDTCSLADGWTDRRLFEGACDWFGVVAHTTLVTKDGDPFAQTILRDDAMARIFKHKPGSVCKVKSQTTPRLGFGVKASQDRAVFSKG
jgi:hypothetical protein